MAQFILNCLVSLSMAGAGRPTLKKNQKPAAAETRKANIPSIMYELAE